MGNTDGRCSVHGVNVKYYPKRNKETDRLAGGCYRCPKYHECGTYFDFKKGVMVQSKRITGEE